MYTKYRVELAGKGYAHWVDTLKEAREHAIDGVTRLHVSAAFILKRNDKKTHKDWVTRARAPDYDDFEKYTIEYGKVKVRKRW
jgi:hypothetical protein